mmetsp:Transcript_24970/g.37354  ORF Transcript_24970/g.37354 Transcript_24970/m.37354 type:complete len:135 (-) Transcript_24970:2206-2610(-)
MMVPLAEDLDLDCPTVPSPLNPGSPTMRSISKFLSPSLSLATKFASSNAITGNICSKSNVGNLAKAVILVDAALHSLLKIKDIMGSLSGSAAQAILMLAKLIFGFAVLIIIKHNDKGRYAKFQRATFPTRIYMK